jgi:hypothetical protein
MTAHHLVRCHKFESSNATQQATQGTSWKAFSFFPVTGTAAPVDGCPPRDQQPTARDRPNRTSSIIHFFLLLVIHHYLRDQHGERHARRDLQVVAPRLDGVRRRRARLQPRPHRQRQQQQRRRRRQRRRQRQRRYIRRSSSNDGARAVPVRVVDPQGRRAAPVDLQVVLQQPAPAGVVQQQHDPPQGRVPVEEKVGGLCPGAPAAPRVVGQRALARAVGPSSSPEARAARRAVVSEASRGRCVR